MAKGYSGQNLEANKIKKQQSSHDFRAMIRASALAAKDQGLTDAWSVLNALADDISVAKKLKAALNSKTQGISLLSKATTKHCTLCSLFIYMTQFWQVFSSQLTEWAHEYAYEFNAFLLCILYIIQLEWFKNCFQNCNLQSWQDVHPSRLSMTSF